MMLRRACLLVVAISLLALPALAGGACSAEYSGDQCMQMNLDPANTGDNPNPGSGCPYYLCTNSTGNVQSNMVWCPQSASYVDCPIAYCSYSPCIGESCTPESGTCKACASQAGNNVHVSDCPKQ